MPSAIEYSTWHSASVLSDSTGAVAWESETLADPVLLDPVEWIILQCLADDDDIKSLASDVAGIVGVSIEVALRRIETAMSRFEQGGLIDGPQGPTHPDPYFPLSTSH